MRAHGLSAVHGPRPDATRASPRCALELFVVSSAPAKVALAAPDAPDALTARGASRCAERARERDRAPRRAAGRREWLQCAGEWLQCAARHGVERIGRVVAPAPRLARRRPRSLLPFPRSLHPLPRSLQRLSQGPLRPPRHFLCPAPDSPAAPRGPAPPRLHPALGRPRTSQPPRLRVPGGLAPSPRDARAHPLHPRRARASPRLAVPRAAAPGLRHLAPAPRVPRARPAVPAAHGLGGRCCPGRPRRPPQWRGASAPGRGARRQWLQGWRRARDTRHLARAASARPAPGSCRVPRAVGRAPRGGDGRRCRCGRRHRACAGRPRRGVSPPPPPPLSY